MPVLDNNVSSSTYFMLSMLKYILINKMIKRYNSSCPVAL